MIGSGTLSSMDLEPHIVYDVTAPALIHENNYSMNERWEGGDAEESFDVDMEFEAELAAWSFKAVANFSVSCSVTLKKSANTTVVVADYSPCKSYRKVAR